MAYAYLNTRVSIHAGRLWTTERLSALVEQSLGELGNNAGTASPEAAIAYAATRPELTEQILLTRLLEDVLVIVRSLTGADRSFLEYGIHWFELSNLKALLRGKFSGLTDAAIRPQLVDTAPFTTLPIDALLRTEDPAEMLRRLENTPYADIARHARRLQEQSKDLFSLEAVIDRRFLVELQRRAQMVHTSQRAAVMVVTGHIVDTFNLLWLMRYRFSYQFSPAETFYLLVPVGHRISADRLLSLAQLGSLEELLVALPSPYKEVVAGATSINDASARVEGETARQMRRAIEDLRYPLARAFAYLVLREGEMRRLLAILKGKQLQFGTPLVRLAASLS